jgi:hypothetical protein
MLERVTVGQTRFAMPGVAPDTRGIAIGKYGLCLFPTLEGVVGWLRLYADEDSLDEILPAAKLARLGTPLGGRAFGLTIPAGSSYVLDRAARCAKLAGGQTFTGTARHFVKYRDERSPYGYDVVDLGAGGQSGELVLHGDESSGGYHPAGDLDIAGIILRLSLRRVPGGERLDAEGRSRLLLTVAPGLSQGLIRYLVRNRVDAEVAQVTREKKSAFARPGESDGYMLIRTQDLPERLLAGLMGVPGVSILRPILEHVAVQVGWAHPIQLGSCASLFDRHRLHLFWGEPDQLDQLAGPFVFSQADRLLPLALPGDRAERRAEARAVPAEPDPVGIPVKLVPTLAPPRRVVATLVGWEEAARLKKLIYALPPVLLRGHQVAATERGLLLVCQPSVDVVPLGTLMCEAAPGLLIPLGMDLVPRVATDVLAAALSHQLGAPVGGQTGRITVFPHQGSPFFVPTTALAPLERRAVAEIPIPESPGVPVSVAPTDSKVEIANDPVGRFALWGYSGKGKPKPKS